MKGALSGDQEALKALAFLPCRSSDSLPRLLLPEEDSLPVRPQELTQLVCLQPIDCGDAILLVGDLLCVGVTTFQNPICCCKSFSER